MIVLFLFVVVGVVVVVVVDSVTWVYNYSSAEYFNASSIFLLV